MGVLKHNNPTLADVASRMDDKGNISDIIEMLTETNEILEDATWLEANGFTEHKTTVRSGLPQGTWRMLNYGVQPEKSTTVTIKDSLGMLESYALSEEQIMNLSPVIGLEKAWATWPHGTSTAK